MSDLARDCDVLIATQRELDRLRMGVVDLRAQIRTLESRLAMALNHGTVPQNGVQVIDSIGGADEHHAPYCHSDTVASPNPL